MKGFTLGGEDTSMFWGVPKNNDQPFPTTPEHACSKRDYYAVEGSNSLLVEQWYAKKIEPKLNVALNHIKEHSTLPKHGEMSNLILLLATLYLRTPSFRAMLEAPRKHTKRIVDSICEDVPISNRHDFEYSQTDLIESELSLIDTVCDCLSTKFYRLHIISDAEFDAVTSDRPFVLSHPQADKNFYFGLNTPDVEILVPLTRRTFLVARNEPFEEGEFFADNTFVGIANTKIILSAHRFFYSSKPEIALADDDFAFYKHSISH